MKNSQIQKITNTIETIKNWPKENVEFLSIGPVLRDSGLFKTTIDLLAEKIEDKGYTKIVALDARGFIFGAPLSYNLNIGLVMARKKGKLPPKTVSCKYDLEYGSAEVEINKDDINKDDKILIIDDVLATGGTAKATMDVCKQLCDNDPDFLFLIELGFLPGREKLGNVNIESLIIK